MEKFQEEKQGGGHSNTPPANYKRKLFDNVVAEGIDTLKIGFVADLKEEFMEKLAKKKELAQDHESDEIATIKVNHYEFKVNPTGSGNYTYVITNDLLYIAIIDRVKNDSYPNVMITMRSQFLWSEGVHSAYNKARNTLVDMSDSIVSEKVSRVDLCADIAGQNIENKLSDLNIMKDFVTRAVNTSIYQQHRVNTGFRVGSGSSKVMLRIYDKRQEIKYKDNKKIWFYDVWGLDKNSDIPVWRVEFQLNRKFFSDYMVPDTKTGELHTIETFNDLMFALYDIWDYLVNDWFSVRKQDDSNTSRRTVYAFWKLLQTMDSFLAQTEKIGCIRRTYSRASSEELLINMQGFVTSLMAIWGLSNLDSSLKFIMNKLEAILRPRFKDDIKEKEYKYQGALVA